MLRLLWRWWRLGSLGVPSRRRGVTAARRCRPGLEILEDRLTPTTYTVNTLLDSGSYSGTSGDLRYCLSHATSGSDTIQFSVSGTITLGSALPAIAHSVTLKGPGATDLTINGNSTGSVFVIDSGETVSLSGLTITGGKGNSGPLGEFGGGIYNDGGTVTLSNSSLAGNDAEFSGGGIFNDGGTVTLSNSSLAGNDAEAGFGGGIFNDDGTVTLSNSTLSGNSAIIGGGGIFTTGGAVTLQDTIDAGNQGIAPDFAGTVSSNGSNLIGDGSGSNGWSSTDQVGGVTTSTNPINPLLAPLGDYGGPTQTMALLPGSPAIDAGSNALIPPGVTTDQRGLPRIVNDTVDIGAFEDQLVVTAPVNQNATVHTATALNLGSFSDSDPNVSKWSVVVNWGDGSPNSSITRTTPTLGSLPHTYAALGSYTVTVTVSDTDGNSNQTTFPVTVSKASQSINFTAPTSPITFAPNETVTLKATASSGATVSFSIVAGSQYASLSGNTITILGATPSGTQVTVEATQAGNATYSAAPAVEQSFTIARANQSITITQAAPSSAVYGSSFSVAATASSGLPVRISGEGSSSGSGSGSATISMSSGTGSGTVTFSQAGNSNYNPATAVVETIAVQQANQSISVVTGTNQGTILATAFSTALQVVVKDAHGNPISGVAVTFTVVPQTSSSGVVAGNFNGSGTATVTTSASGVASAPTLTAGDKSGSFTVIASIAGLPAADDVSFNLTVSNRGSPVF